MWVSFWVVAAGWGMGFGGIFMILFWAVIIVGAIMLFRWMADQSKGGKTALQILPHSIIVKL